MKKHILAMLLALTCVTLQARPVDQETARNLGQSFVRTHFEIASQSYELTLAQTAFSDRGEACYYIFNVGETGFVILAADDNYRPIIGYSHQGAFNPNDMAPAMTDYLERVRQGVMKASAEAVPAVAVAADWAMLEQQGRLVSRHGGRADAYLVQTTWNQNYPYNYYCPVGDGSGPGGHCYAGCVATAAAQLMKYWNHPLHGLGTHSYVPEDHPEYGTLSVNFGTATYDWDNMPNSISSNSPLAQIKAVGLLIYHAGVSVDMNYRPTSSGAYTGRLCEVMPAHFYYTNMMSNLYREEYSHAEYMQLIIDAVDMNWPMVHRGGGHAYVLDGYNDNDMVHFNWGWSGSGDGWYNVDEHDYTEGESVIYNYVPAEIFSATPNMPTDLTVVPSSDQTLAATISWTNPTITMSYEALSAIDQIVVERNGQVVYTENNVAPGATMSFVDETIPYIDAFDYSVYAITQNRHGAMARSGNVFVGPTCNWRLIGQTTNFQGWNGGYVSLYNTTGKELQRFTLTNSSPTSLYIAVPVGTGSFSWTAPATPLNNMSLAIKDSENNSVFVYQGSSTGLPEGTILEFNNGCGNENPTMAPYDLQAEMDGNDLILTWESDIDPMYGFNIYRDEQIFGMVPDGTSRTFTDSGIDVGHCYTVTILDAGGESPYSNETCASAGDCLGATNLDYEYTGNYYRIKLKWDKPEPSTGLSGYFLYRKTGEDGTYERIKLIGSSATSYTDNTTNQEGDYYYRLYAYYRDIDCTSAPASVKDNPNLFYLRVYYSPTDVVENDDMMVSLSPNPADQSVNIEAEGLVHVTVYNMLGQFVYDTDVENNVLKVNVSDWTNGIYLVKIQTTQGQVSRRISVVH